MTAKKARAWTAAGCVSILVFVAFSGPVQKAWAAFRFQRAVAKTARDPGSMLDKDVRISTTGSSLALSSSGFNSRAIGGKVAAAYATLKSGLKVEPITYFSQPASMPVEETIWQYPGYFVRLYSASSLDGDYAAFRRISDEPGAGFDGLFRRGVFVDPASFFSH